MARTLNWQIDPLEAVARFPADRKLLLLHSGRAHRQWARWTLLGESNAAYCFTGQEGQWFGETPDIPLEGDDPFTHLQAITQDHDALWMGYFSYDLGRWIEKLPEQAKADRNWPVIQLERCPGWLLYDHLYEQWTAHGTWEDVPPELPDWPVLALDCHTGPIVPTTCKQSHIEGVKRVLDYIRAGDVFQVNLTHRLTTSLEGHARTLWQRLAQANPAWYSACLELTQQPDAMQRTLVSGSPELFLTLEPNGQVMTRPIKGTQPSSVDPKKLEASEKDAAELHMIVDLMRNDLGRVCQQGSIHVEEARVIETHPTVHHGVSTIRGKLKEGAGLVELLQATMPGGSITGAPKIRAMEIIESLEPVRRGPYCGTMGYLYQGKAVLNMAIRTALCEQQDQTNGRLDLSVGGGIVADSDPELEYEETLHKAQAMLQAMKSEYSTAGASEINS